MIKQIVSATVGVAVWAAIAAEGVRPQAELLVSVEFASFSAFQQKVVDLGTTINNPVVSMMAVPAVQNALTEKFGGFRPDDPMLFLCYGDMPELRRALEVESGAMATKAVYPVFLYPCAEGAQKFLENHPEAQKKADGTIELEDGNVVLFAADGRTCAFAKDVASAKRALADATFSKSAVRPLIRLEVTEPAVGLLADVHQKLLQEQSKAVQAGTEPIAALIASFMKIQQTMGQVQNAKLRTFARLTMSLDLDETGFVFKGLAPTKPGSSVSPAAGFRLPAGALGALPAGSPLFFAANSWLTCGIQSEGQYRALVNDLCGVFDSIAACSRECSPKCAETVKGLCAAGSDLLKTVPTPAPTDWFVGALGFGPQQEPYLVANGACAQAPQALEAGSRFNASVAAIVEKSWPGILRAQDANLTVNWFRLADVITEAMGNTPKDREEAEKVKQVFAAVVGGSESVIGTKLTTQTSYSSYLGAKGLTPTLSSCESRLAAVLPEVGADRPSGVFYMSLYSLVRDNLLPIAVKAVPQKEKEMLQSFQAVLPPAGANGALAGASWEDRNGTRWLFRVTKDEIRSIAAAVNAAMAAQAEK